MKEIGSEFWNVPICNVKNNIFPEETKWFLSGRSALRAIIQDIRSRKEIHTASLPSWCCESIILPFLEAGLNIVFYPVTVRDGFQQDIERGFDADILLVMNYFGYKNKPKIINYNGIIISDLTHSIFCNYDEDADYYFGSLRKWCGIWTGGFAYKQVGEWIFEGIISTDTKYISLRKRAMKEKEMYISGKTKNKDYLHLFQAAERQLDRSTEIQGSIERDISLSLYLDISYLKQRRQENARTILERLSEIEIIRPLFPHIKENDCPLFVPVLSKKRNNIKNYLIEKKIYLPVHWPLTKDHHLNKGEKEIYEEEISIVCDQRYDTNNMNFICSVIRTGLTKC